MRKASEIRKTIKLLVASAGKLQARIHDVALECAEHAQEHGDVTLADTLVKSLETEARGQRTETLKLWFKTFTPIRWNGKEEIGLDKEGSKTYTPFDLESASANPYYQFAGKEKAPTELTMEALRKMLNGMLARVERAEKGEGKVRIADGEDVEEMKMLARQAALIANTPAIEAAPVAAS